MAAGDIYIYPRFHELLLDGTVTADMDSVTIKCALFKDSLTAQTNSGLSYYGSVTTEEVSGTNYTAGGEWITMSVTTSSSFTIIKPKSASVTWSSNASGFADARWGLLYLEKGTAAASPVVGLIDLAQDRNNTDGDFTITWNTNGIIKVSGTALPSV